MKDKDLLERTKRYALNIIKADKLVAIFTTIGKKSK